MTALTATPETFEHAHDADCIPCDRPGCTHPDCQHEHGDHQCQMPGCDCPRWLAHGDCPGDSEDGQGHCSGNGGWWLEHPTDEGRDVWIICGLCHGTGVYYNHERHAS